MHTSKGSVQSLRCQRFASLALEAGSAWARPPVDESLRGPKNVDYERPYAAASVALAPARLAANSGNEANLGSRDSLVDDDDETHAKAGALPHANTNASRAGVHPVRRNLPSQQSFVRLL